MASPLAALLQSVRGCLDRFPDERRGANVQYRIGDIGMAAFSAFFVQSPSFLARQRLLEQGHCRSNCESLFGIAKIPSDNHIRTMLDPAAPALLDPAFAATLAALEEADAYQFPSPRRSCVYCSRWHRIFLFQDDQLSSLFDQAARQKQ